VSSDPEREIYSGRVVTLRLKQVRTADGRLVVREVVEHAPGVAVVAVDDDGQVLLVRQPRPAVGARLLELPAGIVDPGETPLESARRELAEETGFAAQSMEPLVEFYTSPGFSTERLHVFAATGLGPAQVAPDEDEEIELVRVPVREAVERILGGEITDAKTIAGLLAYLHAERSASGG
jgi:ADP-ribose pyrophosphatase